MIEGGCVDSLTIHAECTEYTMILLTSQPVLYIALNTMIDSSKLPFPEPRIDLPTLPVE